MTLALSICVYMGTHMMSLVSICLSAQSTRRRLHEPYGASAVEIADGVADGLLGLVQLASHNSSVHAAALIVCGHAVGSA